MDDARPRIFWLFSYGTLRQREVQLAVFGREVAGEADVLTGFVLSTVIIKDPGVVETSGLAEHLILRPGGPGDEIAGMAFAVTEADLARADDYETDDYVRIETVLKSGRRAFVYVGRD